MKPGMLHTPGHTTANHAEHPSRQAAPDRLSAMPAETARMLITIRNFYPPPTSATLTSNGAALTTAGLTTFLLRWFPLLAVGPVAQRPRVRAPLGVLARVLAGADPACLVRGGTMVGEVVLLEDHAGTVQSKRHVCHSLTLR
jgi:hypothetical protein